MATDRTIPAPCNPKIFKNGKGVCVIDGSSNAVERWVRTVAKKANAKVDWHYSGGRANVLHLGDDASRQRVLNAIHELEGELKGGIYLALVVHLSIELATKFPREPSLWTPTSVPSWRANNW